MKKDPLAPFETVRLREQALLERLWNRLRRIDKAPSEHVEQVRDALFHTDHPFLIVLVGPFNSGKSTLINALIGANALETGPTPTTMRITILRHADEEQEVREADEKVYTRFHPAPILENVSFVDTPGLESVFREHEVITRRFLHRADVVMLVMLATQALSAGSLDDLIALRDYGKPVILLVNQTDLLAPGDAEKVQQFIVDSCRRQIGEVPELWMVSGKQALQAQAQSREDPLWQASGMGDVLAYIEKRLGDRERIRRKLHTPIQIGQNVTRATLDVIKDDIARLDAHRSAVINIRVQIDQALEAQQKLIDEYKDKITLAFEDTAERGAQAIGDMFRLGAAFRLLRSGLAEMLGLARFSRRLTAEKYAQNAFQTRAVDYPMARLGEATAKLPARLEGADLQDLDGLVEYGRAQVEKLPDSLHDKVIGRIAPPATYRREHLQATSADLHTILEDTTAIQGDKLEMAVRNAVLFLAFWEIMVLIIVVGLAFLGVLASDNGPAILLIVLILVMMGFAWMPVQAIRIARRFTERVMDRRDDFVTRLDEGAGEHLEYARQVRENAAQPYTRLVDTQTTEQDDVRRDLEEIQEALTETERILQAL
ncbi:MAG: dynamin family protein [Anaerolineae bacterium]|nr:dynamin family protein [Anaerolineae bacterium]